MHLALRALVIAIIPCACTVEEVPIGDGPGGAAGEGPLGGSAALGGAGAATSGGSGAVSSGGRSPGGSGGRSPGGSGGQATSGSGGQLPGGSGGQPTSGSGGQLPGGSGGQPTSGSGGQLAGGSGGQPTAGTGGVVERPECDPTTPPDHEGPYPVTFQIRVATDARYFLRQSGCFGSVEFDIYSCREDGLLTRNTFCTPDCEGDATSCGIVCGQCQPDEAVSPDEPVEWSGVMLLGGNAGGCDCVSPAVAPAGQYELRIPFYRTEQAAIDDQPSTVCAFPFELPDPDGIVDVVLTNSSDKCQYLN